MYACNAPFFKRKFYELIGIQIKQEPIISFRKKTKNTNMKESVCKYVILECSPFNYIDSVGAKLLIEVKPNCLRKDKTFFLSDVF